MKDTLNIAQFLEIIHSVTQRIQKYNKAKVHKGKTQYMCCTYFFYLRICALFAESTVSMDMIKGLIDFIHLHQMT